MKNKYLIILIIIIVMSFLFFWKKKDLFTTLKGLLIKFEGFSSKPYWDVSRWSWGYGTQVPDSVSNPSIIPQKTINKTDAMNDAINISMQNQQTLRNYLKQSLTDNQWSALLSFAYNLGVGNAIKLVDTINTGNMQAIGTKWNEYIYVNGVPSDDLIKRRAEEFALFDNQ